MASDKQAVLNAIAKYGASVDHIAARYTNPVTGRALSGRALLAKLLEGESSALSNPEKARTAVSGAGAKAWGQFMPGSRQEAISKFGLDPWRSVDEAVHSTALHLRGKINGSTGLEGYNPGDPTYTSYILNQKVGHLTKGVLTGPGGASATVGGVALTGTPATVSQSAPSGLLGAEQTSLGQAIELATTPRPTAAPAELAAPSFAAAPTMVGAGQLPSGGGPAPAPELQLPDPTQTSLPGPATSEIQGGLGLTTSAQDAGAQTRVTGSATGKVVIAPGAERAGVGLKKPILGLLHDLSAASGREVDVSFGTNHKQFVQGTQRESDHWTGNAADLGVGGDAREDKAAGRKGDLIAAHALQVASGRAGDKLTFAKSLQMAKQGGVFNFETPEGRVQVLWRTTQGGNHYNHVHVGLNPGS